LVKFLEHASDGAIVLFRFPNIPLVKRFLHIAARAKPVPQPGFD
jgi:hypothetical protein